MSEEKPVERVLVPTTEAELDAFVQRVVDEAVKLGVKVENNDDTYDSVATMIMHLNGTVAYVTLEYFACSLIKSLANKAAYSRLTQLREKREAADKAAHEKEKQKLALVPNESGTPSEQPLQNA